MNDILTTFSPQSMAAAIEENHEVQLLNLGRNIGAKMHEQPEWKWFISDIPSPTFNVVARTRLSPEDTDAKIKEILKIVKKLKIPLGWWVFPATKPIDLGEHLISHGLAYKGDGHGAAADLTKMNLDQPLPEGLTIEPVVDAESLRSFLQPFSAVHKTPDFFSRALFDSFSKMGLKPNQPYRHYIGWMGGKPVSTGSLLLSAGVAGFYNGAVLPEFRKRGIGGAMVSHRCKEALAMNYRFGVLIASNMMWPIVKAMGYKEYCQANYYEWEVKNKNKNRLKQLRKYLRRLKNLCNFPK